jgi:hypothetical protein
MARFNTQPITGNITAGGTVAGLTQNAFTELTGTAPYTVTLPSPLLFPGYNQTFYNATSGTITLTTPAGNFTGAGGSGTATVIVPTSSTINIISDGVNYVVVGEDGTSLTATTGAFSGNVTINGAGATLSVTPQTVTIAPGGTSTIDNINIGATTRGSGAFTSLAANAAVTFTANTASSTTGTGTLVVTGGIGVSGNINSGGTVAAVALSGPLTGTIQTAAQPNITSVGALTGLAVDTNTIYVDATNHRLGVGTSSPSTNLTVGSTAAGTGASGGLGLFLSRGVTTNFYEAYDGTKSFIAGVDNTQTYAKVGTLSAHDLGIVTGNGYKVYIQNSTGKVGVGTNSPDVGLSVGGAGTVGGNAYYGKLSVYGGGDENSFSQTRNEVIRIGRADITGSYYHSIWSATGSGQDSAHWLRFYLSNANGTSQTMTMQLDANGNVGIGTTSPGYRLDVAGTVNAQGIQTSGTPSLSFSASKWMVQQETTAQSLSYYCGPDASTYGTHFLYRATSTGTPQIVMTYSPTGNVGVGTTGPSAKLHIVGTSGGGYSTTNKLILQRTDATNPTGSIEFQGSGGHASPYWNIVTDADVTNDWGVAYNGSKIFQILTGGNVGIGNNSPAVSLDISTRTDAVALPKGTTAQRPGSPAAGMARYNTSLNAFEFYKATEAVWVSVGILDGSSQEAAAPSGQYIATNFPSFTSGYYWIKSASMPNALRMYVDMTEESGGYDFYAFQGTGTPVSYITDTHSGKALGLELVMPRSKYHWRAMRNYVTNVLGSSDYTYFASVAGIYRSTGSGSYTSYIMRNPTSYGSGAPDWRVLDGGRWWLRDTTYTEPNGDYTINGFLGDMARGSFTSGTYALGDLLFNDGGTYTTGAYYLVSTNAKA